MVWLGSDATTERFFSVLWNDKKYVVEEVDLFWDRLVSCVGDDERDLIVSIDELLGCITVVAAQRDILQRLVLQVDHQVITQLKFGTEVLGQK